MRRTTIKPQRLYQLAKEYLSNRPIAPPNPKGGRPRTYDDALILNLSCVKDPLRLASEKNAEQKIYHQRPLIEGLLAT